MENFDNLPLSDEDFSSIIVNRGLPSLHGGSLGITRTFPLIHSVESSFKPHPLWI